MCVCACVHACACLMCRAGGGEGLKGAVWSPHPPLIAAHGGAATAAPFARQTGRTRARADLGGPKSARPDPHTVCTIVWSDIVIYSMICSMICSMIYSVYVSDIVIYIMIYSV